MKNLVVLVALAVVCLLSGCGSDKATVPLAGDNAQVSAREVPAEVQRLLDQIGVTNSGILPEEFKSSGIPTPSNTDALYDTYNVTFIWGSLLNATTPSNTLPLVDWSGDLTVSQYGVISATKTIAFEAGQDYLLPVSTPAMSAWVSKTSGDFDGLNFIIRFPKVTPASTEGTITFATTPFDLQLTENQLKWFSAYYQISNTAGIVVHSQLIPPADTLERGLMTGHWIKANVSGDSGTFNGLWLDENNSPAGYFSGIFWTQNDGRRLFSGSVSGYLTDQVIAYLHGTWYYDDPRLCPICGSGHGRYTGFFRYVSENADAGMIGGEFGSLSLPPEQLDLPLSGFWAEMRYPCASAADNVSY